MALDAEDFGHERNRRGSAGDWLFVLLGRFWQGGEARSAGLPPVQQPVVPPAQAAPPTQPDAHPRGTSGSAGTNNPNTAAHPARPQKPPVVVEDHPVVQPPVPKPPRGRNCSLDDSEIPSYLSLAERYRNSGKYDRAISNYNLVLSCQPGNRQAQAGLHTAEEMEKYSH